MSQGEREVGEENDIKTSELVYEENTLLPLFGNGKK